MTYDRVYVLMVWLPKREMVAADIYEAGGGMYEHLRPREMTAADLGLSEYDISDYHALYRRMVMGDAPYAFWLGACG